VVNFGPAVFLSINKQIWTSSAGHVSRINYGNYETMSGIIAPPGVDFVKLRFDFFDTQSCCDRVVVKSCKTSECAISDTIVLGSYSGSQLPSPVTSDTGIMLIEWTSDGSQTYSGWAAHWTIG
jgi:hypothetical protein